MNCAVTPGNTVPGNFSSHWVGLDGFSSHDGGAGRHRGGLHRRVAALLRVARGLPPARAAVTLKITPGDSITASVRFSPSTGKYRLEVRDNTNWPPPHGAPEVRGLRCVRSSAEVIREAPSSTATAGVAGRLRRVGLLRRLDHQRLGPDRRAQVQPLEPLRRSCRWASAAENVIASPTALHGRSFTNYWLGQN